MWDELKHFPVQINDMYAITVKRIERQPANHVVLAKQVLSWLAHVKDVLRLDDLQHAVAVSQTTHQLEPNRIVPEGTILSICFGLVAVDTETREVRLVREYLNAIGYEMHLSFS